MGILVNFDRRPALPTINVVQTEFHSTIPTKRSSAAEAIKNIDDIIRVQDYIRFERPYKNEEIRYRDYLLFTMGINFGLRAGDLLKLKIGHLVTPDGFIRDKIILQEEKTDKFRTLYMNDEVIEALSFCLQDRAVDLDDFLFQSYSHNNSDRYYEIIADKRKSNGDKYEINGGTNTSLSVDNAGKILKKIIMDEVGLKVHASTHCMRKTFGYQVVMNYPDRTRAVEHLQKIFGHSSPAITMRYIGITDDEIRDTYHNLNLGHLRRNGELVQMNFAQSSGLAV